MNTSTIIAGGSPPRRETAITLHQMSHTAALSLLNTIGYRSASLQVKKITGKEKQFDVKLLCFPSKQIMSMIFLSPYQISKLSLMTTSFYKLFENLSPLFSFSANLSLSIAALVSLSLHVLYTIKVLHLTSPERDIVRGLLKKMEI